MRALYLAATIFCLSVASAPAEASHRQWQSSCYPQHKFVEWPHHQRNAWLPCRGRHGWSHHLRQHYARVHVPRTGRGISLPGCFYVAAAMGGPCGCWTEKQTRGFEDHVREGINWWLAGDWLRLPRAIPVLGTAAVYKNRRHVAPVLHANLDGTVTVNDYWGTHRVPLSQVAIVDPHPPIRAGYRWPSGSLS